MIIVYCCLLILLIGAAVLRRRLIRLGQLRFRGTWLIWAALADQVVLISVLPERAHAVMAGAHLASYAAAAAFIWANRKLPGGLLVFLGGASNTAAIVANQGVMPASKHALVASGWKPQPGHFANSSVIPDAHLRALGDIFATPKWLPGHDVFSVGDALIVVGVGVLVWITCRRDDNAAVDRDGPPASASPDRYDVKVNVASGLT